MFVQSFEPGSLKEMRSKGLKTRMVQLVDGDDIDLKTGKITYAIPFDRPYDWRKSGDGRLFADMVMPAGLAEIRTYADGIGVWKPYIVPVKGHIDAAGQLVDVNGDGQVDFFDYLDFVVAYDAGAAAVLEVDEPARQRLDGLEDGELVLVRQASGDCSARRIGRCDPSWAAIPNRSLSLR